MKVNSINLWNFWAKHESKPNSGQNVKTRFLVLFKCARLINIYLHVFMWTHRNVTFGTLWLAILDFFNKRAICKETLPKSYISAVYIHFFYLFKETRIKGQKLKREIRIQQQCLCLKVFFFNKCESVQKTRAVFQKPHQSWSQWKEAGPKDQETARKGWGLSNYTRHGLKIWQMFALSDESKFETYDLKYQHGVDEERTTIRSICSHL